MIILMAYSICPLKNKLITDEKINPYSDSPCFVFCIARIQPE
jgi:hypothetical protein